MKRNLCVYKTGINVGKVCMSFNSDISWLQVVSQTITKLFTHIKCLNFMQYTCQLGVQILCKCCYSFMLNFHLKWLGGHGRFWLRVLFLWVVKMALKTFYFYLCKLKEHGSHFSLWFQVNLCKQYFPTNESWSVKIFSLCHPSIVSTHNLWMDWWWLQC